MTVKRTGIIKVGGFPTSGLPESVAIQLANARASFDVNKFNTLVYQHGYDVLWEKIMYCPFRAGPAPYNHDISCSVCGNSNFVTYETTETRMVVQSVKLDEQYFMYGRYTAGSIQLTPLSDCRVNFWDAVTFLNGSMRFIELLRRDKDTVRDIPKYAPLTLEAVRYVDRNGTMQEAVVDTDITIDDTTGELVWLNDVLDPDTYYSVAYTYRPKYIVMDLIHGIREQPVSDPATGDDKQVTFSQTAVARLSFLVRDEAADPDAQAGRENPFPS